jgi:hypothetical protein
MIEEKRIGGGYISMARQEAEDITNGEDGEHGETSSCMYRQ